jgi:hypothetical protein
MACHHWISVWANAEVLVARPRARAPRIDFFIILSLPYHPVWDVLVVHHPGVKPG